MKLIKTIKREKNFIVILFSDEEKIKISDDTFTDYFLYEGKEVEDNLLKEILEKESILKHKKYCLNILSNKYYSKKQIEEKLRKRKVKKEQIEIIIDYLLSLRLIDDDSYFNDLVSSLESKGYGYYRIINKIKENGLNGEYIYNEDKEYERINLSIQPLLKKYSLYSFNKMKSSIYSSLLSLGYKDDLIQSVIQNLKKDNEQEIDNLKKEFVKIVFKMDKLEINEQKDKIIKKLMMHGYVYSDIIKTIDGEI